MQFKSSQPEPEEIPAEKQIEKTPADSVRIIHSPQEFVLEFFAEGDAQKRIVSAPEHVKALLHKLENAIAEYEHEHGTIRIPKGKEESFLSEIKRNLYRSHKVGKNLRIINPTRKRSESRKKK